MLFQLTTAEENWTFGVGSVNVDPFCPLSASSTSSPLIAGWTDAVTVLILSLLLLGRKMCLNLWRYLFPIVSLRLWKLPPKIMSLSLICLPVLSTVLCEVRFSCETQQLKRKIFPTKPLQLPFLPSAGGLVTVTGLESCSLLHTLLLSAQLLLIFVP